MLYPTHILSVLQDGETELQLALELFEHREADGGEPVVDVAQLESWMASCGERPLTADEMRNFKQLVDPNGRGKLSAKEFRALACWTVNVQPYSPTGPVVSTTDEQSGGKGGG